MSDEQQTLFAQFGGETNIEKLVDRFYGRVAEHPELAPIFPDDLTETKEKQRRFLTQFLGGPSLYSDKYGHPRLRARHLPFPITPSRAKAWLSCMHASLTEIDAPQDVKQALFQRLTLTAQHMVNTDDREENDQ